MANGLFRLPGTGTVYILFDSLHSVKAPGSTTRASYIVCRINIVEMTNDYVNDYDDIPRRQMFLRERIMDHGESGKNGGRKSRKNEPLLLFIRCNSNLQQLNLQILSFAFETDGTLR